MKQYFLLCNIAFDHPWKNSSELGVPAEMPHSRIPAVYHSRKIANETARRFYSREGKCTWADPSDIARTKAPRNEISKILSQFGNNRPKHSQQSSPNTKRTNVIISLRSSAPKNIQWEYAWRKVWSGKPRSSIHTNKNEELFCVNNRFLSYLLKFEFNVNKNHC